MLGGIFMKTSKVSISLSHNDIKALIGDHPEVELEIVDGIKATLSKDMIIPIINKRLETVIPNLVSESINHYFTGSDSASIRFNGVKPERKADLLKVVKDIVDQSIISFIKSETCSELIQNAIVKQIEKGMDAAIKELIRKATLESISKLIK